ncbi:MAG: DNA polymerase III subunit epsilon [Alphaproteobacteria bacterium]|nr:DNA polymerase III subunit epsilon [Alphaproteobacteria bacterium]
MREIVLDTETTGLDPASGHRVVEIACIELENHVPTGRHFHTYCNPEREMPADAFQIHGLSTEFLAGHPPFADKIEALLAFLGEAQLVIHNAEFDLRFLDYELTRAGRPALGRERGIVDTVTLARRKYPGAPASLDALCRRFEIDLTAREKHGAMLDCELLALVYLELVGGREPGLDLAASARRRRRALGQAQVRPPRPHGPSEAELEAHAEFVAKLKQPVWLG